jgi:transcriptional regulator with XRE-family HTH domain
MATRCVYAFVMDAAMLVKAAREEANLTVRALAARAGVAASTVSRIERRQMDPTVGMLDRLLDAAGQTLELTARRSHEGRLGALTDAWRVHPDGTDRPDWTRLRVFLDYLWLHPALTRAAIADKPDPSGSQVMDNLLAAMAEKLSDDAELPRPSWTAEIPGLSRPWCTPATPRMHAAAQSATAPQLVARGFVLASNSLWRDRWNEVA